MHASLQLSLSAVNPCSRLCQVQHCKLAHDILCELLPVTQCQTILLLTTCVSDGMMYTYSFEQNHTSSCSTKHGTAIAKVHPVSKWKSGNCLYMGESCCTVMYLLCMMVIHAVYHPQGNWYAAIDYQSQSCHRHM